MDPNYSPLTNQYEKLCAKSCSLFHNEDLILQDTESIFSDNRKTGFSINFPILETCEPSALCKETCYASDLSKPITWKNSLLKQLKVYNYFLRTPTLVVARRIIMEYHKKGLEWIRFCGSGDLFKEAVNVINVIPQLDQSLVMLVVTRKPEMANQLCEANNLFIMFSVDGTCKERRKQLQPNQRLYYSFLRVAPDEDTCGAAIVFNEQRQKKTLPYDDILRCCPVDANKIPVQGACNNCRKCFSERVLSYQQEHVGKFNI